MLSKQANEFINRQDGKQRQTKNEQRIREPMVAPFFWKRFFRIEQIKKRHSQKWHKQRAERPVGDDESDRLADEMQEHRREGEPKDVEAERF